MIGNNFLMIIGMHRSGTSLVTSYLENCGLNLGNNLMPPDEGNPKGYYENLDLYNFQNGILLEQFGSYFFKRKKVNLEFKPEMRLEAQKILNKIINSDNQIGLKDPRTSMFLDFWFNIFKNREDRVNFLFVYRDPLPDAYHVMSKLMVCSPWRKKMNNLKILQQNVS